LRALDELSLKAMTAIAVIESARARRFKDDMERMAKEGAK
jgi:hypothetical protein